MATYNSHVSLSVVLALGYAAAGALLLNISAEHLLLASVLVVIAGMLPDIDAGKGAPPREIGGLLAAVSPLVVLEFYPSLRAGGIARVALVVICSYILTRILVNRVLFQWTRRRGIIHSVPAAIITFELVYLVFYELFWIERLYISFAAFVGFFSHLMLDASSNLDLLGKAMGANERQEPALKFTGESTGATLLVYASMLVLGWFVVVDLYPGILERI